MLSDGYSTDDGVIRNLWKLAYKKLRMTAASKPDVSTVRTIPKTPLLISAISAISAGQIKIICGICEK